MKTRAKRTSEIRTYEFPFGVQPEFDNPTPATIVSVDSITSTPSGPTLSGQSIFGSSVFVTAAGGTNGTRYLLNAKITLNTGGKLEDAGILSIVDPVMAAI